jgi:hypothetical protein
VEAAGLIDGGNTLNKKCKDCLIDLTTDNAAKKDKNYYRKQCKRCRSKSVSKSHVGNTKRHAYINAYLKRTGKVKQYPCELCSTLCYKKYARAFCSDNCRFMSYVEKTDSCWIWKGTIKRGGYGKLCFKENKSAIASRVAYELFNGPIQDGMYICHLCDVPSCVNPDHLWVGSHMENTLDMIEKERQHSKLLSMDIIELRRLWQQGASNASLCERFNITSGTVSSIIHRRIWKHV